MLKRPLPIGVDNFEDIITKDYYYVDKTLLIKELLDNKGSVNLFTRPRRFGKTLNLSMLQFFFEDTPDKDNAYLFNNLNIMQSGEEYLNHMQAYPVINITLKSAKQNTLESAMYHIKYTLASEYNRHSYLMNSDKLSEAQKVEYNKLTIRTASIDDYKTSLKFLSECLFTHHNKKAIILIDEYDVPLENSYYCKFYDDMVDFIRALFESALKTNPFLEFSVITGCLRISKESIFTGLNNLNIVSILNPRYSEYFGFTEDEVADMLSYYELITRADDVKSWYNGYTFGSTDIYNPWSLIKFVWELVANIKEFPKPYWANTSSNTIIRDLIDKASIKDREDIEILIAGGTITKTIHEDITYADIYTSMDNLWNFLFFTGYLRKESETIKDVAIELTLSIPNKEILYIYKTKILSWFEEKVREKDLKQLYNAILTKDIITFEKEINSLLLDTISFMDSAENFYHGFIVGILSLMDTHIVKSNRESGKGRNDIFIKHPQFGTEAYILELKTTKKPRNLLQKCDEALQQIIDKDYAHDLIEEGYDDIIKYGLAFCKKNCMIKML